jgi:hypothetical protein
VIPPADNPLCAPSDNAFQGRDVNRNQFFLVAVDSFVTTDLKILAGVDLRSIDVPSKGRRPACPLSNGAPGAQTRIPTDFSVPHFEGNTRDVVNKLERLSTTMRGSQPSIGPNGLSASTNGPQATAPVRVLGTDLYTSTGGTGLVLKSPNQSVCRRLGIDDAGILQAEPVTPCPPQPKFVWVEKLEIDVVATKGVSHANNG